MITYHPMTFVGWVGFGDTAGNFCITYSVYESSYPVWLPT